METMPEYNQMYIRKQKLDPSFRAHERTIRQNERQDMTFKANELSYQGKS